MSGLDTRIGNYSSTIGLRFSVASYNKPVEFEKQPVEVQDFRGITHHFRGVPNIVQIYNSVMQD